MLLQINKSSDKKKQTLRQINKCCCKQININYFKQIKVAANKLKLLQTKTKNLCARRNRKRLARAVQHNGGNGDAVTTSTSIDVLYPLRRGSSLQRRELLLFLW